MGHDTPKLVARNRAFHIPLLDGTHNDFNKGWQPPKKNKVVLQKDGTEPWCFETYVPGVIVFTSSSGSNFFFFFSTCKIGLHLIMTEPDNRGQSSFFSYGWWNPHDQRCFVVKSLKKINLGENCGWKCGNANKPTSWWWFGPLFYNDFGIGWLLGLTWFTSVVMTPHNTIMRLIYELPVWYCDNCGSL